MKRLEVLRNSTRVGWLSQDREGRFSFTYEQEWLEHPDAKPISVSLPLQSEPHGGAAHHFFSNLLPEGELRRALCARLGISLENDFELLAAIGGECAGALTLQPEGAELASRHAYRELSLDELERLAANHVLPAIDGRSGLRLSLAGAQDKLPVRVDGSSLLLPIGAAPSTHILKFSNPHYKHLPANEVFTLLIARKLGLPVVDAEFHELRREGMCVVRRYDRRVRDDGMIERLHQEDLCQVLGIRPALKYEREGGPGFLRCFDAVREVSSAPLLDSRILLRWLAFNVIAFNADGHAKNLSLLYAAEGVRLAPLYDLICTRAYPHLAAELAMSVAGVFDPTHVLRRDWVQLAEETGVGVRFLLTDVRDLAERTPDAVKDARAEFIERHGDRPALKLIAPKVVRQARRVAQLLAA